MFRDRTGGNPLFVEELSRMAFANRLLFIDGAVQARSSVAATKGELDGILERQGLPGTIEGVIRRRLDGLSHQDVSVLRAASVVGQSFDRDLCSVGAPTLTPVEVERSLAALTGLGVIEPSDRGPDEFVFRHAVLRDVVYNTMSFAERRQIHDAVGSWIEAHPQTEDVSALLGRHFLQAQRTDKAIRYLIAAGEIAIRRYANAEAAELLMRAHELDKARPDASADGGPNQRRKGSPFAAPRPRVPWPVALRGLPNPQRGGPEAGGISRAGELARRRARSAGANRQTGPLAILAFGPRNARLREGPSARGGSRLRGVGRDLLFFGRRAAHPVRGDEHAQSVRAPWTLRGACPRLRDAFRNHRVFPVAQGLGPLFGASIGNSSQS